MTFSLILLHSGNFYTFLGKITQELHRRKPETSSLPLKASVWSAKSMLAIVSRAIPKNPPLLKPTLSALIPSNTNILFSVFMQS